jgi:hypothetical protein
VTPVIIPRGYKSQLSIVEPLPTLGGRNLALAKTLVIPKRSSTICRMLNPTNAPISLRAQTAVATIEPIDPTDVDNRKILTSTSGFPKNLVNSIATMTNVTHEVKLQTLKTLGLPAERDKLTDNEISCMTIATFSRRP